MKRYINKIWKDYAVKLSNGLYQLSNGNKIHEKYIEKSNDWEEVIDKINTFIITSFRSRETKNIIKLQSNGLYTYENATIYVKYKEKIEGVYTSDYFLTQPDNYEIYSIKNDKGIEFKVWDDVCVFYDKNIKGKIKSFTIFSWGIENHILTEFGNNNLNVSVLEHIKTPLAISEDGVELFEGDSYYSIRIKDYSHYIYNNVLTKTDNKERAKSYGYLWFSNKENILKFIKQNKKQYSLNDIEKAYGNIAPPGTRLYNNFIKELTNENINN